jgi:hypothetical protein|tara:strand:+ start:1720 stop:1884 length:165 start_codon:yes stop_codon:yes gene_type:complete
MMKKTIKRKLSLNKFTVAKLVNPSKVIGGNAETNGGGDGDTILGDSTRFCKIAN